MRVELTFQKYLSLALKNEDANAKIFSSLRFITGSFYKMYTRGGSNLLSTKFFNLSKNDILKKMVIFEIFDKRTTTYLF